MRTGKQHNVTALTPADWAQLAAKNSTEEYVVVATVQYANGPLTVNDQPKPFAEAMERFNSHVASAWAKPDGRVRVRVMSVSEWTRVGAR